MPPAQKKQFSFPNTRHWKVYYNLTHVTSRLTYQLVVQLWPHTLKSEQLYNRGSGCLVVSKVYFSYWMFEFKQVYRESSQSKKICIRKACYMHNRYKQGNRIFFFRLYFLGYHFSEYVPLCIFTTICTLTGTNKDPDTWVFRFRTFKLNHSWILSQLSYERVLYIKSLV